MSQIKIMLLLCLINSGLIQASESVVLDSDTGDTLMFHRLNNGEIWGSFMITDQIAASFADQELIVLQVDQNQPIKLDKGKLCGGGKAETSQQVSYSFKTQLSQAEWQFNRVEAVKPDILKLAGWDKNSYQHMRSDRRPEVVDFPIQGSLAIDNLWQQFTHGDVIVFRYVTDAAETRQAEFYLRLKQNEILKLLKH
ncbi:MAG: hypothetical protein ACI9FO_000178 [Methylophagaceae bacterium]|jgi:hypothetical protein